MAQQPDGTYRGTTIYVTRNADGVSTCVETQTVPASAPIPEGGCTRIPDTAFHLDKRLRSATLDPVTVTIASMTASRDVKIAASWEGMGDVSTTTHKFTRANGSCTDRVTDTSKSRAATSHFTLDGVADGGTGALCGDDIVTIVTCR